MAVKKKVTKKKTVKSDKPNYKWDLWLNGKKHTLKSGKDFTCTPKSMVHYIRKRGIIAGKSISAEYLDNGDIRIQVSGKYTGVQTNPLQTGSKKAVAKKSTKKKVSKKKKTTKKKATKKKA